MSGTNSSRPSRRPEVALGAFWLVNLVLIEALQRAQTVPFHLIWISLALFYGYRAWSLRTTGVILLAVSTATTGALLVDVVAAGLDWQELTEVPLMAAVFGAMVWHVRSRQAALAAAERLRDNERDLLRDASHVFRTPVTIARGYTELAATASADPQVLADLTVVLTELKTLEVLSNRILLLATSEPSDLLDARPVELRGFVAGVLLRWSATAGRRWGAEVSVDGALYADTDRLTTALDAALENAVRYTAEGGTIQIRAYGEAGSAVLEVVDDGCGIPEALREKVFERRWRPDHPQQRSGTGLGLAILRAIVQAHGGTVVALGNPTGGTIIRLRLPRFVPAQSAPAGVAGAVPSGANPG